MLTTESIERKIKARILLVEVLTEKQDWEQVREIAEELIGLQRELYRLKTWAERTTRSS